VLEALRLGRLRQANWYIHEDIDQLPVLAPFLLEKEMRNRIHELVENGRLKIHVPSMMVKNEYDELFATKNTIVLPPVAVETTRSNSSRELTEYQSIHFLLSGRATDGRKGHVLALAAFHEFLKSYYEPNPNEYRDFSLTLIGMTDDYVSAQIDAVGKSILGKSIRIMGEVSHDDALEITRGCNAVICCSFNEALPLYVLEAMSMGHVVIRNNCGGFEEQLREGVNGFRIESSDVRQFAGVLERLLNRRSMGDQELQAMGRASQEMFEDLRRAHGDAMANLWKLPA
jgi:glycosyltransferase involved in cell wall biosynthesis